MIKIIGGLGIAFALLLAAYPCLSDHVNETYGADYLGGWVSYGTALGTIFAFILVAIYTHATIQLRRAAKMQIDEMKAQRKQQLEADTFGALSGIHQLLHSEESVRRRYVLHNYFPAKLHETVEKTIGEGFSIANTVNGLTVFKVDYEKVLKDAQHLKENDREERFRAFITYLDSSEIHWTTKEVCPTLDIPEGVLNDLVAIALPFYEGIESARRAAWAYYPMLERTAPILLGYITLQKALRGLYAQDAKLYHYHYLHLLQGLGLEIGPLWSHLPTREEINELTRRAEGT